MSQIITLENDAALTSNQIKTIANAVKACKIVAFPTDTVYGLGSTGLVKAAARRIYQIKERPSLKPLPILVHSIAAAKRWVEWTKAAEALSGRFWPGALTLVLKPTTEGRLLTFAEYQTVAIRVPNHPALLALIEASDVPWVSTSANKSGSPSINDGAEVIKQFDGVVDWIIDAGRTPGIESSLVDATQSPPRLLREGAIKAADLATAAATAV